MKQHLTIYITSLICFSFFKAFKFSNLISVYNGSARTPENFALGRDRDIAYIPKKGACVRRELWQGEDPPRMWQPRHECSARCDAQESCACSAQGKGARSVSELSAHREGFVPSPNTLRDLSASPTPPAALSANIWGESASACLAEITSHLTGYKEGRAGTRHCLAPSVCPSWGGVSEKAHCSLTHLPIVTLPQV